MLIKKFLTVLFILSPLYIFSDEIIIPFGEEENSISILKSENELWFPRLLDTDSAGNIYIPDFYKGRIAVFNNKGIYIKSINADSGIQSDMNFFNIVENHGFITFLDSTLYFINLDGRLMWTHDFGLGQFPDSIICTSDYVFIVMPSYKDTKGFSIIFNYESPNPLGLFGKNENDVMYPFFLTSSGLELPVKPVLAESYSYWIGLYNEKYPVWISGPKDKEKIVTFDIVNQKYHEIAVDIYKPADSVAGNSYLFGQNRFSRVFYSQNGYIIKPFVVKFE